MATTEKQPYFGQSNCRWIIYSKKLPCTCKAYYWYNNSPRCGRHSNPAERVELKKDPNAKKKKEEKFLKIKEMAWMQAKLNIVKEKKGEIIVSKFRMMKGCDYPTGFLNIFPNFKHGNRKDGVGLATLSPKSLGPIEQTVETVALNLENFHQFSKIYEFELEDGQITNDAITLRNDGFAEVVPYRHKFSKDELKEKNRSKQTPEFSVFFDSSGKEHRFNYIECRYFYCYWYTKLAITTPEFRRLVLLKQKGYNLNIVGYDGYPVTQSLFKCYMDPSKPFGHEMVLYTLLVIDDPTKYPWERYRSKTDIYNNFSL